MKNNDNNTDSGNSSGAADHSLNRRSFLSGVTRLGKFTALLAILFPVARFVKFSSPPKPKLVKVDRPLRKDSFIIEPDFILFDIDNEPVAVSRTCTHLGCKVNYHELEKKLICPCHRSQFSKLGKRLAGPAQRDLPTYKVETTGADKVAGYIVTVV